MRATLKILLLGTDAGLLKVTSLYALSGHLRQLENYPAF